MEAESFRGRRHGLKACTFAVGLPIIYTPSLSFAFPLQNKAEAAAKPDTLLREERTPVSASAVTFSVLALELSAPFCLLIPFCLSASIDLHPTQCTMLVCLGCHPQPRQSLGSLRRGPADCVLSSASEPRPRLSAQFMSREQSSQKDKSTGGHLGRGSWVMVEKLMHRMRQRVLVVWLLEAACSGVA